MKLILIICFTTLSILFSGCEEYERHKQIELEKKTVEKTFKTMNENKEVIISTKKIINLESEKKGFYGVYEDKYIKSVSFEKIKTFYNEKDKKEEYFFIVKIVIDKNQFNISDKKIEDEEIKINVSEEDKDFIMNIFNGK